MKNIFVRVSIICIIHCLRDGTLRFQILKYRVDNHI